MFLFVSVRTISNRKYCILPAAILIAHTVLFCTDGRTPSPEIMNPFSSLCLGVDQLHMETYDTAQYFSMYYYFIFILFGQCDPLVPNYNQSLQLSNSTYAEMIK